MGFGSHPPRKLLSAAAQDGYDGGSFVRGGVTGAASPDIPAVTDDLEVFGASR